MRCRQRLKSKESYLRLSGRTSGEEAAGFKSSLFPKCKRNPKRAVAKVKL